MSLRKFKYTAVNLQKQKIKGTFIAKDEKDLAQQLAKQSLYVISATPYKDKTPSAFFTTGSGKVKLSEITTFCRQFSIMLNTHIPILDSLDILKNQSFSAYFKKILQVIYDDVKGGTILSAALEKHKKVFPQFFRSMVYVGEMSGKLDLVFTSLADYYEKDSQLRRKIKSAMAYPIMLMFMTVAILVLMFAMVVPTFRDSMSTLEVEASGLTKAVYDISDFFAAHWYHVVLGILIFVGLIFLIGRTEKGKYAFDYLKLKLPLIRKVQQNMVTARFARGFGLLLSSGMDLNEAMNTVEVVLGNRYIKRKFHDAAESVRHGMSLTVAFDTYKLFPPMMIQMIQIGEKTASIDEVLTRSCDFFDGQVESTMSALVSKIQPVMLILMGGIIGTLFVAVYSPMLSIMNTLV
ncbi:MAG: type II secretion system F family protein [Clostridiales bacterium]|nr:type II secretion system F family protein [Clostridiales bacterium]